MIYPLYIIISGDYVAGWCRLPYPGHPKGCPNFGKKEGCPPKAPRYDEVIDPPYYLVWQQFDLAAQEKRMKERHPEWSTRQARCCLYWQRGLMSEIIDEAWAFIYTEFPDGKILMNPEGALVDLFATCKKHGIYLERDYLNQQYVYKMVIVGKKHA